MARFLLIFTLLTTSLYAAPPAIQVTVPTGIGNAPYSLRLRITLEPDPRNRWVCLYVRQTRGGAQEHNSCWDVQAEREARTTWRLIKDLDAGEWTFIAAIMRNDEQSTLSNREKIQVFGFGYEPPPTE